MTGIIKSSDFSDIVTVTAITMSSPVAPVISICKQDEERDRLQKHIVTLEEDARQHNVAIEALRGDIKRAFDEGRAEGRMAGRGEADGLQAALLLRLEKSVEQSQGKFSDALTSLSRLSTMLARDCVDIILGNADDRAEFINRIIETQISKIDKAALLVVELSRQDFPDDDSLAALTTRLDMPAVNITAQSGLASGACIMTLRLGSMDVGINQQWGRLRDTLEEMSLSVAHT